MTGTTGEARASRSLGGLRMHAPSLAVFLVGAGIAAIVAFVVHNRNRDRERAAFDAEATNLVSNLRSAFELPLEIVAATGALFEASADVSRAEFARFVKPALERHPGIRALEWIPVVRAGDRERLEAAARADGLQGFHFRQHGPGRTMVAAAVRDEHLPIYYMEPGHPLVLGFDCASDPERRAIAERARNRGAAAASERLQLLDDPPSAFSIAVFHPVFDLGQPRTAQGVRGFTVEVFRVRVIAEPAIAQGLARGLQVVLLDPEAPPDKRLLYESREGLAAATPPALHTITSLRYADRNWRLILSAGPQRAGDARSGWLALLAGLTSSGLLALGLSARKLINRLRHQVRAAQQLGQYTLLEKLGQGGVGVVYKARHAMLRRPTAIKLLAGASGDRARLARFEREVQLTSELTHPNTIAIYDYGRTPEGIFYYAMEYIDGITLEQMVERDGTLPPGRVVHLLAQACQAIAEAHAVGLVHRDIKPANLMICQRGGLSDFLKVMDFGLVKDLGTGLDRSEPAELTQSTAVNVIGTPLYLAPESISRPGGIDGRADLYALGAVAYFLLVGEPVFRGQTVVEVAGHHLHTPPPRPSDRAGRAIPVSLERIVLRCLAKQPDDRFATAMDLRAALLDACSPKGDVTPWTDEQARDWWRSKGDALVAALRAEQARDLAADTPTSRPPPATVVRGQPSDRTP